MNTSSIHRSVLLVAALSVVAVSWMLPASGQDALKTKFTDAELLGIVQGEGYTVEISKEGLLIIKIDGSKYLLYNLEDGDLQLFYGISDVEVTFEDINEWNRTKRLSRAYLDTENDPCIECDLLANAGLSPDHVIQAIAVFKISVSGFLDFLNERTQ
jgi:Putative bacterial sensory transduction regulator